MDSLIAEARTRAEAASQTNDRIALARARTELAVLLEILKRDPIAALAEYRAAHAIAPSSLAPIAAARRLTPLRPIAPALTLLEAELRVTTGERIRAVRLLELGRLLAVGGAAPEKTVQTLREVLAIEPLHPGALRALERALRTLPRALENVATLDALASHLETMAAAWRADRRFAAWLQVERALFLERLRKPDAALAAFEAAMELDGGIGPVRDAYTRHLIVHQKIDLLVEAWSAEASLEGDTLRAGRILYAAGRLASERLEQIPVAIDLHRRATALQAMPIATRRAALRELFRLYEVIGDIDNSVEAQAQLLLWVDESERPFWHRRLSQVLEGLERWGDVVRHAREALTAVPDDEDTRERLDRSLQALGRHEERVSMWTTEASRVTATQARIASLSRGAQIAEKDLRRDDLALALLRAAWTVDPDDAEVADAIARLLTPLAPPNPADPADPARARARIDFYTEAAAKAGDGARKIAQLEKLAQLWEDEVRAPDKALEVYREILVIEPGRRSALLGLQRNAARAGDARELFRALVMEADSTKNPALERSLLLRAAEIASSQLNDADTALDLVKRVLSKNAGDPLALRASCRIHQRTGRHDEAVAQLRLLLSHMRKGPGAFAIAIDIAVLLEQRIRRRDEALAAYREAFRIDPTHPLPAAEIRRILLAADDHRAIAEELTQMAASATTPETRARLLLEAAEVYDDRLNDIDRAVALLNQARALLPDDRDITDRLERACLRQNKIGDLVAMLEARTDKTPGETFTLGLLLAEDRDTVRATTLLGELLATDKQHVPAQRTLEHALARTEQFTELDPVLRLEAAMFETEEARLGAVSELVVLEEYRGVSPPSGAPPATELLRALLPEDVLLHEMVLKRGLATDRAADIALLTSSLGILAASSADAHYAATLQLLAALALERSAPESDQQVRRDALRRYRLVMEGWPECLTAARSARLLAANLGDADALIEASTALGNLESVPERRARRLIEAAQGLAARRAGERAVALFARALGEDPNSELAANGLLSLAFEGSDPGHAADALRRALDRTTVAEQAVRLGSGLATLAIERLGDPTVAVEALRRVRKKAPGNVANLLSLAETSASLNLWADAAEIAVSAIGITRDPAERLRAAVLLAQVHAEIPDARKTARREAEDAEKLVETAPLLVRSELLAQLGKVYAKLGEPKAAEHMLIRAVLYGGSSTRGLELLAGNYPIATVEGAKAFLSAMGQVIQQAGALKMPVEPIWIATMGKVEATLLSKPRDGLAKLKEAIRIDPARIESYKVLAEVYDALGAHDEAVKDLLSILPEVIAKGVPLDRVVLVFNLLARECKLARRMAQAATAEAIVAYFGPAPTPAANPVPSNAPVTMSLAPPVFNTAIVPPDVSRPWPEVAAALAEITPKLLRVDPFALGLSPRDRLPPRAPHPLRALCDRYARAFGEPKFDLFVEAASVGVPRIVPSDPPAIVLPRGFGDLSENEQAVGICRLLVYLALGVPWLEDLAPDDLEGLFFGALRLGNETWKDGVLPAGADANAGQWRVRIARVAGRKQKRALEEIAQKTDSYVEPLAFRQTVRIAAMRVGYLLTGDLSSTLNHLLRIERDLSQLPRDEVLQKLLMHPMARDIIFFALAPESHSLRRNVGTG